MSDEKIHAVNGQGPTEEKAIAEVRLVEGAPMARTSMDYSHDDKIFAGEWSCDVGAFRVNYEEWEFCHVLEGACELTPDDGAPRRFAAGDSFVIEPGFKGVWRVLAPMRKRYVVQF